MLTYRDLRILRAADAAQREEDALRERILGLLFPQQRAFIEDPCKFKAAICTRRAGKTMAAGAYLLLEMLTRPKTSCLVVCLTRDNAKRIYWKDVLFYLRDVLKLEIKFNYSELSMTLPNGSVCYFLGVDAKEDEKRKILGQKYSLVVIDESSEYRIDLRELVYQTLKPCVNDYRGTICMVGTAGEFLGPVDEPYLFYAITRDGYDRNNDPMDGGWSTHRWTTLDNPHQREQHLEDLADIEKNRPDYKNTTAYLTHYLARWPSVSDKLVYKYSAAVNDIAEAPECDGFIVGCDLGSVDDTSFIVAGWKAHDPNLYIVNATKRPGLNFQEVANELENLRRTYRNARLVIDGANKQGVDHMRNIYGLPLENAEKSGKWDYIRMMNTDLQMGRVRVVASTCKPLIDEWRSLEWDKRKPREEAAGQANHCADAALYGWRLARHFFATPEKPARPTRDSEEAFEKAILRRPGAQRHAAKRRGLL